MTLQFENGLTIPSDWDGQTWDTYIICCPKSVLWEAYFRGVVNLLTRGRTYSRNTGVIKDAQEIGYQIEDSIMNCGDLSKILKMLYAGIVGIEMDLEEELPTTVNHSVNGLVPTIANLAISGQSLPDILTALQLIGTHTGNIYGAFENPLAVRLFEIQEAIEAIEIPSLPLSSGGGGCGCGPTGYRPPSPPFDPSIDTPPPGWGWPTDEEGNTIMPGDLAYADRKCKIISALLESTRDILVDISESPIITGILEVGGAGMVQLMIAAITNLIAALDGALPILDVVAAGVFFFLEMWAYKLLEEGVDAGEVAAWIDEKGDELACLIYAAPNAAQASIAISDLAYRDNLTVQQIGLLDVIFIVDVLNLVYLQSTTAPEEFEEMARAYIPIYDCVGCACSLDVLYGSLIEDTGAVITGSSLNQSGFHRFAISLCPQNDVTSFSIFNFQVTAGSITPPATDLDAYRMYSPGFDHSSGSAGDMYSADIPPSETILGVQDFYITSTTPFSVLFLYSEDI